MKVIRIALAAGMMSLASQMPAGERRAIEADPASGRSAAVVVPGGALLFTGQLLPPGPYRAPTPPEHQVQQVLARVDELLQIQRLQRRDIVRLQVYLSHPAVWKLVEKELAARWHGPCPPAVSLVQTNFAHPGVMVAVDFVAQAARDLTHVVHQEGRDSDQPAWTAWLPAGPHAYISGQAEKGDGSLYDASKQTLFSLRRTLEYLGAQLHDVVHLKAFLTPIANVTAFRKALQEVFEPGSMPPVSVVEWKSSLPIEIEVVARCPAGQARLEYLTPPELTASPLFSRVVRVHDTSLIFVSGLYGRGQARSEQEVHEVFQQLQVILQQAGSDLRHLAKATYYVSDETASHWLNEVRSVYYDPLRPPAASKAHVLGTGLPGRSVTLDMIAVPAAP